MDCHVQGVAQGDQPFRRLNHFETVRAVKPLRLCKAEPYELPGSVLLDKVPYRTMSPGCSYGQGAIQFHLRPHMMGPQGIFLLCQRIDEHSNLLDRSIKCSFVNVDSFHNGTPKFKPLGNRPGIVTHPYWMDGWQSMNLSASN